MSEGAGGVDVPKALFYGKPMLARFNGGQNAVGPLYWKRVGERLKA